MKRLRCQKCCLWSVNFFSFTITGLHHLDGSGPLTENSFNGFLIHIESKPCVVNRVRVYFEPFVTEKVIPMGLE